MVSGENRVLLVTTVLALLSLAATFALAPAAYSSVLSVLALVGVGLSSRNSTSRRRAIASL